VTLSIQRVNDFIEAHEIADERQILAIASPARSRCLPGFAGQSAQLE
jgi:hypothetical protein